MATCSAFIRDIADAIGQGYAGFQKKIGRSHSRGEVRNDDGSEGRKARLQRRSSSRSQLVERASELVHCDLPGNCNLPELALSRSHWTQCVYWETVFPICEFGRHLNPDPAGTSALRNCYM
jgi:hypothetical protein